MKIYASVTILSLPNQNREIISIFGENSPISQLIIDKDNNKVARREHSNEIHTSIFSYISFISMSTCLENILKKNNTNNCSIDMLHELILPNQYYMVKLAPNCSVNTSFHHFTTNNTVNIYENS